MTVHKYMCKACGQPLPPKLRGGVYLSAKKAEIFDFIDAHPGVTVEGIAYHCFGDESKAALKRVHVHVNQINDMLVATGIVIVGRGPLFCKGEYRVLRSGRDGYG